MTEDANAVNYQQKIDSFQDNINEVITGIAGGVSAADVAFHAQYTTELVEPNKLLKITQTRFKQWMVDGIKYLWVDGHVPNKVKKLETWKASCDENCTTGVLLDSAVANGSLYTLVKNNCLHRYKETLVNRVNSVKKENAELCKEIDERRSVLKQQKNQMESIQCAIENNMLQLTK